MRRLDLPDKVFGAPRFIHDLRLPGMLHARMVRPPARAARLLDLRSGPLPGDAAVLREGSVLAVVASEEWAAELGAARVAAGDRTADSPLSPRSVMRASYWSPDFSMPADREDVLLDELLLSVVGDDGYPGDSVPSANWPGMAPGSRGILNALSPKYCNWSGLVDVDPKPPVLWTHGTADIVIADGSAWEMGSLGAAGQVPGWPGAEVFPPQQMVAQTRAVLERYRERGGQVREEVFEGSGHGPLLDAEQRWCEVFFGFVEQAEAAGPAAR